MSRATPPKKNAGNFDIITPPNKLKEKVGDGDFTPDMIHNAESAVREMGAHFINDLVYDARDLKKYFDQFLNATGEERRHLLKQVVDVAHTIKGLGGSFGYPFILKVSRSLCYYMYQLEETNLYDDLAEQIMDLHIRTLLLIGERRIMGDGGTIGKLIAEGLEVAVRKHLSQDQNFLRDAKKYLHKLQQHMDTENLYAGKKS